MRNPGQDKLADIETQLFGCSLQDIQRKICEAGLGRLWLVLEGGYSNPSLALETAARNACISPSRMNDLLRKACQLTFRQLLIRMRLLAAVQSLKDGPGARIEELATRVGFGDPSNFRRQFKRSVGCSAKAFQQNR